MYYPESGTQITRPVMLADWKNEPGSKVFEQRKIYAPSSLCFSYE